MTRLALAVALLAASPALAQDFAYRGQWETRWPDANYVGIMLIDGEGRATYDAPNDAGRVAKFLGYAGQKDDGGVVIVLTDKVGVAKTYCDIRSSELLHCYIIRASGNRSANFLMVKVGPGPEHLTPSPSRN